MKKTLAAFVVGFVALTFASTRAEAISAWAKKYGIDCSTCHDGAAGKLTPLGSDFLRRGHRMADDKIAENWNELFSINTKLRFHDSNAIGRNSTFEAHAFSIYTGGMLSSHFSYFTEMYLYENVSKTTGSVNGDFGRSKLADAYLMYNSSPSSTTYTTIKFGQISPSQLLLYWNVGPRYSETRPYIVNNSAVSPNSYRPFMRNFGIELGQTISSFHGAIGVLNGTGSSPTNSIDNNESKDVYATIDFSLDDQGSAVGFYGYKGRGLITSVTGSSWENEFSRVGAFVQWVDGPLTMTYALTGGTEQLDSKNTKAENLGLLFETDYKLTDKVVVFGRYDYFDSGRDQLSGPMFGANYRLFDSGRATFEYHKQGKQTPAGQSKPWECRVEVAFMF